MLRFILCCLLALFITHDSGSGVASAEDAKEPTHQLRIATLAPRRSPLGKSYQKFRKEMRERTNGDVTVKMYYGGVAGDEISVVRKMCVGQLDGALLTATGLGALVPQVLVLQAPGVITSYPALDKVCAELKDEFAALFDKAGYELIVWGDSGRIRIFSKYKIKSPSDLKKVRPWAWRDSATMKAFIKATGANGVLLGVPEVYPALQTGMVDTVIASSIAVLAFQWHSRLKTMAKQSSGIIVGAFVIKKDRLASLPKAARDYIRESTQARQETFRKEGRDLDEKATEILAKRLEGVGMILHQRSWEKAQVAARNSLAGRLYSRSLLKRVQQIAASK